MARILIVEDETRISDFLDRGLRAAGHTTSVAADGTTEDPNDTWTLSLNYRY